MGQRLLVIGGDAGGMAAAAVARRRAPGLEIVVIERGKSTSYSACGIHYLLAGTVHKPADLVARTPDQFRATRIDVRTEHEVAAVDLAARRAEVHNLAHGRTFQLGFDMLHVATGSRPRRLDLPGSDAEHVHGVQTLDDGTRLLDDARTRRPECVAVIGSGYTGLKMAEAFAGRGAAVTVIEQSPDVARSLDPDIGALVARAVRDRGITLEVATEVKAITPEAVVTSAGEIPATLVVLGSGVVPNSELAAASGLDTGAGGGIVVDRQQRTSAEGVWAAGDCCQSQHLVSGRPVYTPVGTVANKHGRVAGINISGGYATFPGVLGTEVARVCGVDVAKSGLTEQEAADCGFSAVSVRIEAGTTAGYVPGAGSVTVKLTAERRTGVLLGAQMAGAPGSGIRVDVVAAALAGRLTVDDLLGLDLGYDPAISAVWDPLQVAARSLLAEL